MSSYVGLYLLYFRTRISDMFELLYRPLLNTFLKDVCCLKNVNLADIDYRSEVAYCFFVNVYHSLLLHSRLLLGLPCDENQAPDKAQEVCTVCL